MRKRSPVWWAMGIAAEQLSLSMGCAERGSSSGGGGGGASSIAAAANGASEAGGSGGGAAAVAAQTYVHRKSGFGGWNVFVLCAWLRYVGYSMIGLTLSIVVLNYYTMVFVVYGPMLLRATEIGVAETVAAFIILALFHGLVGMLLWAYFVTVVTSPGIVPRGFSPPERFTGRGSVQGADEASEHDFFLVHSMPSSTVSRPRFCRKCQAWKPERAHHCSACNACVLKMDHHCIWVVNCIGARNYKSFMLFLFYTMLASTLVALALFPVFVEQIGHHGGSRKHKHTKGFLDFYAVIILTFILDAAFAVSLLGFVLMHLNMIKVNETSIETYNRPQLPGPPDIPRPSARVGGRSKYDLGNERNFCMVFGTSRKHWLLPFYAKADLDQNPEIFNGLDYPVSSIYVEHLIALPD